MDASEKYEFLDLMPHRIKVRATNQRDDFGYPLKDQPVNTYACLLDDKVSVAFTQAGATETFDRVAYILPYPLNADGTFTVTPVLVKQDAVVIMPDNSEREIRNITTHFDVDGSAHNQEIRFT